MKMKILSLVLVFLMLMAVLPFTTTDASAAEAKSLDLINLFEPDVYISAIVVSPDSKMLLVQDINSCNIYIYNINAGVKKVLVEDLTVGVGKDAMCFSPDSSLCAVTTFESSTGADPKRVAVYDTKSGEMINEFRLNRGRGPVALDWDNQLISSDYWGDLYGSYKDIYEGVVIQDARTGEVALKIPCKNAAAFCLNPSNNQLAVAFYSGTVIIYDEKTGGSVKTIEDAIPDTGRAPSGFSYSPDGKYFAISSSDSAVILDAANNYSRIREFDKGGRISFNSGSDMLVLGNTVYFADDGFNDYTILVDDNITGSDDSGFLTPDGKYFVSYHISRRGVRLLDAIPISLRLQKISLNLETILLLSGDEVALTLTGQYSDGSTQPLNLADAKISVSDFSVAKMKGTAKIQGLSVGKAELKISHSGLEVTVPISVVDEKPPIYTASAWAREAITSAVDKGFVPEDIHGDYTNIITRQEFCRMAIKFMEYKTGKNIDTVLKERGLSRDTNAFIDTIDPDILAAYALGITNGTSTNTFSPDGQFSREQAAAMLMNTCNTIGMETGNVQDSGFSDIGSVAPWAVAGVNFCCNNGIMNGTGNNKFSPQGTYTRQEAIVTFDRIK